MKFLNKIGLIFLLSLNLIFAQLKDEEIVFLHTNDIHGNINNFSKLYTAVNDIKNNVNSSNKELYLVSAGDNFSGNPIVDQYNPKGYPIIDLMNKVGYDFATLGNHEFDYGQNTLYDRIAQSNFKYIVSNIYGKNNKLLPNTEPYKIVVTKNGNKILLIGLIQTEEKTGYPSANITNLKDLNFTKVENEIPKYLELKEKEKADLLVVISHLGYEKDVEILKKYSGIDLIIGGHSHTKNNSIINSGFIVQAGYNLSVLGKTTLSIKNGVIDKKNSELLNLAEYSDNKEIKEQISKYSENSIFKEKIGVIKENLSNKELLGNFMAKGVKENQGLDVYFINTGGIRLNNIDKGDITRETIYKLDPFGNKVVKIELTFAELKSLLQKTYERKGYIDLIASGLKYSIELDENKKIKSIILTDEKGSLLNENKKYIVGMSDYIAFNYEFLGKEKMEVFDITTANSLIDYIKFNK